jgi:hypothetical protein
MKVYTLTIYRTHGHIDAEDLGVYKTVVRAKEDCWQHAEEWANPDESVESTEDGNRLSITIGGVRFCVDEHELVGA